MHDLKTKTLVDNRFEVIERVGVGGMGVVYKAEQIGLDRIVALKVMLPHLLHEEKSLARFELEGQALATLQHRNILSFYAYGIWHGRAPYIAMEYLDSGDLSDFLLAEGGRLSWRRTINIVKQICDAVAHAHQAGIVHRDLKPSNVFLVSDGDDLIVKVADFGLAKFVDDTTAGKQKLTATGLTIGTPHYMSPEQVQGLDVTPSCDIYSVGCLLYQCLFGRPPYQGETILDLFAQHVESPVPFPKIQDLKDFPPALIHLVETALAKEPAKRFATMDEMALALQEIQTSSTSLRDSKANFIPGATETTTEKDSRRARNKAWIAAALLISIGAAACVFNVSLLNAVAGSIPNPLATARFFDSHGAYDQAAPFYRAALTAAKSDADDWAQMEIALSQAAMFKKAGQNERQQLALAEASLVYDKVLDCPRFLEAPRDEQIRFVVSSAMAMADWRPPQPIDARRIQDVRSKVYHLGLVDEDPLLQAKWLIWQKAIDEKSSVNVSVAKLAVAMYRNGLDGPYKREVTEQLEKVLGTKIAKSPAEVQALSQEAVRAAAQRDRVDTSRSLSALTMNYAIIEHSQESAKALGRAMYAYSTLADERDDLFVLMQCFILLGDFISEQSSSEKIEFYRRALANEDARAVWDEADYDFRARIESQLAKVYLDQQKPEEAIAVYQAGIKTAKNQQFAQYKNQLNCFMAREKIAIAEISMAQGNWPKAIAILREVPAMPAEDVGGLQLRYCDYLLTNALSHSMDPVSVAQEMKADTGLKKISVFCDLNRTDLALKTALAEQDQSLELLGRISAVMGDYEKTVAYLKENLEQLKKQNRNNKEFHIAGRRLEYARALHRAGHLNEAMQELAEGLRGAQLGTSAGGVRSLIRQFDYELGNIYFEQADFAQAAQWYHDAELMLKKSGPVGIDFRFVRTARALCEKDLPTARREIRRALSEFVGQASYARCCSLNWYAQVLAAEGKQNQAKLAAADALAHWKILNRTQLGSSLCSDFIAIKKLAKSLGVDEN
jgi:serine/threonine protein kinase/tetratricopeptide (TPR) repeat protein